MPTATNTWDKNVQASTPVQAAICNKKKKKKKEEKHVKKKKRSKGGSSMILRTVHGFITEYFEIIRTWWYFIKLFLQTTLMSLKTRPR